LVEDIVDFTGFVGVEFIDDCAVRVETFKGTRVAGERGEGGGVLRDSDEMSEWLDAEFLAEVRGADAHLLSGLPDDLGLIAGDGG
jgi:hypothetical protein